MRLLGAILLIAGTAIGAGMLALPVLTAEMGFISSCVLFLAIWGLTLYTALLLVEVNLAFQGDVNLISMVKNTLGKKAAGFTWLAFLLLLYSLTAAYLSGSGAILNDLLPITLSPALEPILPLLLLGLFVLLGTKTVDHCNRFFMVGLFVTYLGLVGSAIPKVMYSGFTWPSYGLVMAAIPVAVTSFGFHIVIPTVVTYLGHNARLIKKAIIMGSLIPLAVYLLWEFVILGVIPLETAREIRLSGAPITEALATLIGAPWIAGFGMAFSLFAIITSFLGVSLALFNFLQDGLRSKNKLLIGLTFLPPLIFVELYPQGFIRALQYGGLFIALISCILPALMVYKIRLERRKTPYHVPGGRLGLLLVILCALLIIISDIIAV